MRTVIDLPLEQLEALGELCRRESISRAEAIRRAVAQYVGAQEQVRLDEVFGIWRSRRVEAQDYLDRLRSEW